MKTTAWILVAGLGAFGAYGCANGEGAPPVSATTTIASTTATANPAVPASPTSNAATTATSSTTPTPAATSNPTTAVAAIAVGAPPPDFTATAQDGTVVHLAALKGKPVVVYFYPKDETPGCTKEACSFRDAWDALSKKGVVLVGISADTDDSHKAFAAHHKLPFLLVSDKDGAIAASFGVPFHDGHIQRQSFVVGADGLVKKIYRKVDVAVHAQEIMADVQ